MNDAKPFPRSVVCLVVALWLVIASSPHAIHAQVPIGNPTVQSAFSPSAQDLIQHAFEGLDPALPIVDAHVHIVGNGRNGSGIEINPAMFSPWHPLRRLATHAYIQASGVQDSPTFDDEYVQRLLARAHGFNRPVKAFILAMDRNHNSNGSINQAKTEFYIPNEHVFRIAEQHPDRFEPVISVHPARPDAVAELDKWAAKGVRWVKWLPNAQNIDPSDPRYDAFYALMHKRGMVLLTHAGDEFAVNAKGAQALGNPLKLRRPLDLGVTVIVAHCASLGRNQDLDHPGKTASNFQLFLRLMDEERYRGRLFGDLSAITQANRMPGPLLELLRRPELHDRLVNGSDYPLPGIRMLFWTSECVRKKLITRQERRALEEISKVNPLLFDFVLKRTLRDPRTGNRLPAAVFQRVVRAERFTGGKVQGRKKDE